MILTQSSHTEAFRLGIVRFRDPYLVSAFVCPKPKPMEFRLSLVSPQMDSITGVMIDLFFSAYPQHLRNMWRPSAWNFFIGDVRAAGKYQSEDKIPFCKKNNFSLYLTLPNTIVRFKPLVFHKY